MTNSQAIEGEGDGDIANGEDDRCLEFRGVQLTPQILRLLQAIVLGHCKVNKKESQLDVWRMT